MDVQVIAERRVRGRREDNSSSGNCDERDGSTILWLGGYDFDVASVVGSARHNQELLQWIRNRLLDDRAAKDKPRPFPTS